MSTSKGSRRHRRRRSHHHHRRHLCRRAYFLEVATHKLNGQAASMEIIVQRIMLPQDETKRQANNGLASSLSI